MDVGVSAGAGSGGALRGARTSFRGHVYIKKETKNEIKIIKNSNKKIKEDTRENRIKIANKRKNARFYT